VLLPCAQSQSARAVRGSPRWASQPLAFSVLYTDHGGLAGRSVSLDIVTPPFYGGGEGERGGRAASGGGGRHHALADSMELLCQACNQARRRGCFISCSVGLHIAPTASGVDQHCYRLLVASYQ
jgi:hypothetical protein